jgi:hypothetical protein
MRLSAIKLLSLWIAITGSQGQRDQLIGAI